MLSLLLLAFVAAQLIPVAGQQLNGTRFYVDYNTCSEQCIVALNDTVIQCPHSLLDSARNNFRLPEVKLKPLCQQECFESLNTARQTIAENCNSSSDLIIHYDEEAPGMTFSTVDFDAKAKQQLPSSSCLSIHFKIGVREMRKYPFA